MNPVLLIEINEVPWRVIDTYQSQFAHIQKFFAQSTQWTSFCHDEGELSPGVTWPTFHRGLINTQHQVFNLGQDPSTFRGSTLWSDLLARGLTVGVCGSLQSWPPQDPSQGGFYVPDTFAHDAQCIPDWVSPLQGFNLSQVAANGRVLSSRLGRIGDLLKLVPTLLSNLKFKTLCAIALQLLGERLDKTRIARRPIFQTLLFWDVFQKLFNAKQPPAFSSFFTNHVAGVMHRYWNHIFPEDFKNAPPQLVHRDTMNFAMGVLDDMLKTAMQWQKDNPRLSIVFATSMGQAAIHRDDYAGVELSVDVKTLLKVLGFQESDYKPLLAMVPQVAVEVLNAGKRKQIEDALNAVRTLSDQKLFDVETIGNSLSITISSPTRQFPKDVEAEGAMLAGRFVSWNDLGAKRSLVDAGTAYHISEGILAITGPLAHELSPSHPRAQIELHAIKNKLLSFIANESAGPEAPVPTRQPKEAVKISTSQ